MRLIKRSEKNRKKKYINTDNEKIAAIEETAAIAFPLCKNSKIQRLEKAVVIQD